MKIKIRAASLEDFEVVYDMFCHILDQGDTYSYTREEMTPEHALSYWMTAPGTHCWMVNVKKEIAGFFCVRPNRTGRADHVANASFVVMPGYRRQGIGRLMMKHALRHAKKLKYKAMFLRFVTSTNRAAVNLYQSLGFEIIGTMPKGYRHKQHGMVDVYMMHRFL